MEKFFLYVVMSAICISVFYSIYRIMQKNKMAFKTMRMYLMSGLIISVLLPLTSFQIELPSFDREYSDKVLSEFEKQDAVAGSITNYNEIDNENGIAEFSEAKSRTWNYKGILVVLYFVVVSVICLRLLINLSRIFFLRYKSESISQQDVVIHSTNQINNSFSFFHGIFLNKEGKTEEEIKNIIVHESIHVSQFHSIDILLIELLSAVMWFNPFVWMMRKSLQQIHEYLADEGALDTGISKPEYQALLINQVAEERLIALSSGFNHSLIKKRIIMMTKPKLSQKTNLKILAIIPVAAILFLGIACVNGQIEKNNKVVAAIAPVKMNVMYLGVDNPVNIAVSGYDVSEIEIKVEGGKAIGEKGNYVIRPIKPGTLTINVLANGEVINSSQFRVKTVPNPVAKVSGKRGGEISKEELLEYGKVIVEMENFDFDLSFDIVSFVMSATVPGTHVVREEISKTKSFSQTQIDLINSLVKNQKLMIEEIKAKGPDGSIRKLGSIVFTIS